MNFIENKYNYCNFNIVDFFSTKGVCASLDHAFDEWMKSGITVYKTTTHQI